MSSVVHEAVGAQHYAKTFPNANVYALSLSRLGLGQNVDKPENLFPIIANFDNLNKILVNRKFQLIVSAKAFLHSLDPLALFYNAFDKLSVGGIMYIDALYIWGKYASSEMTNLNSKLAVLTNIPVNIDNISRGMGSENNIVVQKRGERGKDSFFEYDNSTVKQPTTEAGEQIATYAYNGPKIDPSELLQFRYAGTENQKRGIFQPRVIKRKGHFVTNSASFATAVFREECGFSIVEKITSTKLLLERINDNL